MVVDIVTSFCRRLRLGVVVAEVTDINQVSKIRIFESIQREGRVVWDRALFMQVHVQMYESPKKGLSHRVQGR